MRMRHPPPGPATTAHGPECLTQLGRGTQPPPRQALLQARQHGDDPHQERLPTTATDDRSQTAKGNDIEDGRSLSGTATRNAVEPGLIPPRPPAPTFRCVQNDAEGSTLELIVENTLAAGHELTSRNLELKRHSIDVELLG